MRLGLISGGYPPQPDAIGDYTSWLAQALARHPQVETPLHVFTTVEAPLSKVPGVTVQPFFKILRPRSFGDLLRSPRVVELDWLVLQYNPFSFGRRGYCPAVPETLRRIKSFRKRPRLAVMFHETTVPRWPWKFTLMYSWQKPIFDQICRAADLAFLSTERWLPQVRRAAPGLPTHHLPVGSNIPLCSATRADARRESGLPVDALVPGIFGTAHPSRRLDWIAEAVRALKDSHPGRRALLLYVGPHGSVVRAACPGVEFVDSGALPAAEVGLRLRAMDCLLSPFTDGSTTRRGSMVAALQHAVPVAAAARPFTDALFGSFERRALLLSKAEDARAFAEEVREWFLSLDAVRDLPFAAEPDPMAARFGWPAIAEKMVSVLLSQSSEPVLC